MNLLPEIHDGKLLAVDYGDTAAMTKILDVLPERRRYWVQHLVKDQKYPLPKALAAVGVAICRRERQPVQVPEYNADHDEI